MIYNDSFQVSSTPFSFGVGMASGTSQSSSGRVNFDLIDERQYLLNPQGKKSALSLQTQKSKNNAETNSFSTIMEITYLRLAEFIIVKILEFSQKS